MKNLAKLQLQTQRDKGKQKPMLSARTARAVPQMRKLAKQLTGRKEGGTMENPKAKDRLAQGSAARLGKALDKLIEEAPKGSFKDMLKELKFTKDKLAPQDIDRAKKVRDKILNRGLKGSKEVLTMTEGAGQELIGKQKGGVIRPKPTFKGKVLKPKPIKSRGIGMAIRGFGKAFKKGR